MSQFFSRAGTPSSTIRRSNSRSISPRASPSSRRAPAQSPHSFPRARTRCLSTRATWRPWQTRLHICAIAPTSERGSRRPPQRRRSSGSHGITPFPKSSARSIGIVSRERPTGKSGETHRPQRRSDRRAVTESSSSMATRMPSVYEATASGLPPLRQYWAELKERRPFIWHLARSDLKAKHANTALGRVWIVLDPLLAAGVYYLMRSIIRPVGSGAQRNLVLSHLIWAVFYFQYVQAAMNQGARALMAGRGMLLNASFPRAVLPLYVTLRALLDFVPTVFVYFFFQYILGQPFGLSLVMLPVVIAILTVLNMGLAFLLSTATVFFYDMANFLPYITRLLMYISPVLFATYEIPANLK